MRVVITGATGFIGKALVHRIYGQDDHLILVGRSIEKLRSLFGEYDQSRVSLVETEYGKDLYQITEGAEAIVHLSGLRWQRERVLGDYLVNNVDPTEKLFSSAAENRVENIIFLSSIAVYNPTVNAAPFLEEQECFPSTHYGVSKLLCEKIGNYYNSEFGMKIKSLRMGQVVGPGEREGFMLNSFIGKAASRQPLPIFGEGVGARDYIYISDVVAAILLSLTHPAEAGVYNISLGKPVTHLQLAETINRAFDNSGNIVHSPERTEDKSRLWMSCERAHRELGWQPQWGLEEMFIDLADRMNGKKFNR